MNILHAVGRMSHVICARCVQQGGADETESAESGYEQRNRITRWTAHRRNWRPGKGVRFQDIFHVKPIELSVVA